MSEPNVSTALNKLSCLESWFEQLCELSQAQQRVLASGKLDSLRETFGNRQSILVEMQSVWEELRSVYASIPEIWDQEGVLTLRIAVERAAERFLRSDAYVCQLLTLHQEKTGRELVEHGQRKAAVDQYLASERSNGIVAKIFPGNARRFDQKT